MPDTLSANYIINSFVIKTTISLPPVKPHTLLNRHPLNPNSVCSTVDVYSTWVSPHHQEMHLLEKLRQE